MDGLYWYSNNGTMYYRGLWIKRSRSDPSKLIYRNAEMRAGRIVSPDISDIKIDKGQTLSASEAFVFFEQGAFDSVRFELDARGNSIVVMHNRLGLEVDIPISRQLSFAR